MTRILAVTVFTIVVGCGGKQAPPPQHVEPAPGGDEHANMPPEVVKFHDVLSPRWHAEKGPQRMTDTCAAIGDLTAGADSIAKAAPAHGDATKWAAGTKELVDAVGALKVTCDPADATAFELAFHRVHEDFHAVAELAGGEPEHHEDEHGAHGEHGDHGEHGELGGHEH